MAEDPFERWRETMRRFAGGEAPDPADLGPTGWPMLPFPSGSGAADPLSPAGGTKTAVRQLYRSLEELESGSSPVGASADLWAAYREALGLEEGETGAAAVGERVGAMLVGTYLVWLYSLAQLLVESYTMRLVHDELVVDDHRNTSGTLEWLWGLSQGEREALLRRCTEVDDGLVDDLQAIRGRRNDLVYNLGTWEAVDLEDPLGDAREYLRVLGELEDRATAGEPFRYLPGETG